MDTHGQYMDPPGGTFGNRFLPKNQIVLFSLVLFFFSGPEVGRRGRKTTIIRSGSGQHPPTISLPRMGIPGSHTKGAHMAKDEEASLASSSLTYKRSTYPDFLKILNFFFGHQKIRSGGKSITLDVEGRVRHVKNR